MTILCDCSSRKWGYTTLDNVTWLCGHCFRPTRGWMETHGDTVLNYFMGGPLDGYVYETSMLLASPTQVGHLPLLEYNWTPEIKTSEATGKIARVWQHGSLFIPGSVAEVAPRVLRQPPKGPGSPRPTNHPEGAFMSDLKDRRVALGLSRSKLADAAGITQAKLYRIENEGKRTTDEEKAVVSAALDQLEKDQPVVESKPSTEAAEVPVPVPST
jgi:DNA-binding XRE family transcriptional regulator